MPFAGRQRAPTSNNDTTSWSSEASDSEELFQPQRAFKRFGIADLDILIVYLGTQVDRTLEQFKTFRPTKTDFLGTTKSYRSNREPSRHSISRDLDVAFILWEALDSSSTISTFRLLRHTFSRSSHSSFKAYIHTSCLIQLHFPTAVKLFSRTTTKLQSQELSSTSTPCFARVTKLHVRYSLPSSVLKASRASTF